MSVLRVALLTGLCLLPSLAHGSPSEKGAPAAREIGTAFVHLSAPSEAVTRAVTDARLSASKEGFVPPPEQTRETLEGALPGDASAEAMGQAGVAAAGAALERAREAYARFEYDRVFSQLKSMDDQLLHHAPSPLVLDLLIERQLLEGVVLVGEGKLTAAQGALRAAYLLDPSRTALDPANYRPQVVALYKQAQESGALSSLVAVTLPIAAQADRIWIDGRPREALARVVPGRHWLLAHRPGFAPRGTWVEVAPGQSKTARLSLEQRDMVAQITAARLALEAAERSGDPKLLASASADLAIVANLANLVLIRAGNGAPRGTVLRRSDGSLGPWRKVPSRELTSDLQQPRQSRPTVGRGGGPPATGAEASNTRADLFAQPRESGEARPWYRTGWGIGLMVAGGVVAASVAVYALSGDGGEALGGWCFVDQECQ